MARGRFRPATRQRGVRTRVRRRSVTAVILFCAAAGLVLNKWMTFGAGASAYGLAVFGLLGMKLFLSLLPPKWWPAPDPFKRVGVVVTIYNEDPELLRRCLDSVLSQTFPPTRIVVVDDHSAKLAAHDIASRYAALDPRIQVVRQPANRGKREALAVGFRAMADDVDIFLCIDSDSVLERNAVYEGVRPFRSRGIAAVSGIVLPSNHDTNVVTRLQDVRYANSFVTERAAYSRLGSVLCVCGALAFYRASIVMQHLDEFLDQTFLGKPATVGDDRHMTNLSLAHGRVVLADQSISHTAVPQRFGHFVRQQARWGRSFFRESTWALRHLRPWRVAWWLTLIEIAQWAVFSTILIYVVVVHPIITGEVLVAQYLLFVGAMALARAVRYFDISRRHQRLTSRLRSFLVAPLYGYMALFVLLPLRFYSLVTLRATKWGTRQAVEVMADESSAQTAPRTPARARHSLDLGHFHVESRTQTGVAG